MSLGVAPLAFKDYLIGLGLVGTAYEHVVSALIVSVVAALALMGLQLVTSIDYEPPFAPRSLCEIICIAGILAPLGEETLFRGLLEGYLLLHTGLWIAVVTSAILFSLIHIAPFKGAPRSYLAIILLTALIVGLIAGYYRAVSGSLAPAITTHSVFNIIGAAGYKISKRANP
jgi:membrane protease YdiL (CAAX protease family)